MPKQRAKVRLKDGREFAVEYESREQLESAIAELESQPSEPQEPQRSIYDRLAADVRDVPRQFGLTARYGMEAFGLGDTADWAGLPQPNTPLERVVGDASRTLVQGGAMLSGAGVAAKAPGMVGQVGKVLATNPLAQATAATGAGLAGGAVKEGGGGYWEQFGASLIGGLGAGLATNAVQSIARRLGATVTHLMSPSQLEATISAEFKRAGVDWNAISAKAKTELVKDIRKALRVGEPVDAAVLRRLAAFRQIGATPTRGTITQDPVLITQERNLAKQLANTKQRVTRQSLPQVEQENARRVLQTLDDVASSPMDEYATGQAAISRVQAHDDLLRTQENQLYQAARDAAGRDIPLDRTRFVNQAMANLDEMGRGAFLPAEIKNKLNAIATGDEPFTVGVIDQFKTILASASRATRDGNVRMALSAVRNALEDAQPDLPKMGGARVAAQQQAQILNQGRDAARETLSRFDRARAFARDRRTWQESAKFIEDALNKGSPDKFVKKHILNADVKELSKFARFIEGDDELRGAVRRQMVEYILKRGNADADINKFSSHGMQKALEALGERRLRLVFSPGEISQIKAAIDVGRYMQSQPIGSAVNNSNTAAMVMGRISNILLHGQAAPVIGPMIAEPVRDATLRLQAGQLMNVSPALMSPVPRQPMPVNQLLGLAALQQAQNQGSN